MALAQVLSRACVGVEAPLITVEVHLSGGLPCVSIVGMPETAVREARERVRAALQNSGFDYPVSRVTISLAPAELPKDGGGFDLPIALGILGASGQIPTAELADKEFLGELSLSGGLRCVRGSLPAAVQCLTARRTLVIPNANRLEVSLLAEVDARSAGSLLEVTDWLRGNQSLRTVGSPPPNTRIPLPDLSEVQGQTRARRALEITAAGGHHLLMTGPPGTGKTLLASRLPGILPPMNQEEACSSAAIASVSGRGFCIKAWAQRPFRSPHHSCSATALVGGGAQPRPGEISLAHHGVLFLDELPEFQRPALEALREPMESGKVLISRAAAQVEFPAKFQLIGAMNPCPCGYAGDPRGQCRCTAEQVARYRGRISGPLLDRIDLQVTVPRPDYSAWGQPHKPTETSAVVRERVVAATERQIERQGIKNAHLDARGIMKLCSLGKPEHRLLRAAERKFGFSIRACHRILKVARTIADLEGVDFIDQNHLAEAIAYRGADDS